MPDGAAAVATKCYRRGTDRAAMPEATLARVAPHLTRLGITRIADLTGLDRIGIPVVAAIRPNARSLSVYQGKGLDLHAARASGVMEALESWHAEHVCLPLRLGSRQELAGELPLVDTDRLPRALATAADDQQPLLWVEARAIADATSCWVPYECVHTDYRVPGPIGGGGFLATSNGLASGNTRAEALSHALCEVIERDATTLWRALPAAARAATRVDATGIDDPDCRWLLERFTAAGFETAIFDTTTELGVAAFYCVVMDARDGEGHDGAGAGCHPRRVVALARALTEAAQVRTTYIAGARDDLEAEDYGSGARAARRAESRALLADPALRSFQSIADRDFDDFDVELDWLVRRLHDTGFGPALAVDLGRADIGVPVVRVLVPGLEGPDELRGGAPGGARLAAARRGARP